MKTGAKKERVSVAVSGPGLEEEKFLGDKSFDMGTGANVGEVVRKILEAWKVL